MTDESLTPKKREVLFWLDDANGFDRLGAEVMHDLDEYRVLQAGELHRAATPMSIE